LEILVRPFLGEIVREVKGKSDEEWKKYKKSTITVYSNII
jgi:hypothetical protein